MSIFQVAVDTVNYKLTSEKFIELEEKQGYIENNSIGYIEIAIVSTDEKPIENSKDNNVVEPSGKFEYSILENQKVYARAINRMVAHINVYSSASNGVATLNNTSFSTEELDNLYVRKEEGKTLSDNNYTDEEKIKLGNIEYATLKPKDNGAANIGKSPKVAREDHVHNKQKDIEGNSATTTKLANPINIILKGAVTGTISTDLSKDIEIETESGIVVNNTPSNSFNFVYCTELEYENLDKIQDDNTIYLVLNEITGEIAIKVYRP